MSPQPLCPQGEGCAPQVHLCAGSLWQRPHQSQPQLQPLWQVHGHQLRLQGGSCWRTHPQLPAGEGGKLGCAETLPLCERPQDWEHTDLMLRVRRTEILVALPWASVSLCPSILSPRLLSTWWHMTGSLVQSPSQTGIQLPLLPQSRVLKQHVGERNFHAFYQVSLCEWRGDWELANRRSTEGQEAGPDLHPFPTTPNFSSLSHTNLPPTTGSIPLTSISNIISYHTHQRVGDP